MLNINEHLKNEKKHIRGRGGETITESFTIWREFFSFNFYCCWFILFKTNINNRHGGKFQVSHDWFLGAMNINGILWKLIVSTTSTYFLLISDSQKSKIKFIYFFKSVIKWSFFCFWKKIKIFKLIGVSEVIFFISLTYIIDSVKKNIKKKERNTKKIYQNCKMCVFLSSYWCKGINLNYCSCKRGKENKRICFMF